MATIILLSHDNTKPSKYFLHNAENFFTITLTHGNSLELLLVAQGISAREYKFYAKK